MASSTHTQEPKAPNRIKCVFSQTYLLLSQRKNANEDPANPPRRCVFVGDERTGKSTLISFIMDDTLIVLGRDNGRGVSYSVHENAAMS